MKEYWQTWTRIRLDKVDIETASDRSESGPGSVGVTGGVRLVNPRLLWFHNL